MSQWVKNLPAIQETQETQVQFLGQEYPLEKQMVIHSNILLTPWTVASRLLCPWAFPGKNTGVGCHFLLQGIFLTQGSNPVSPTL